MKKLLLVLGIVSLTFVSCSKDKAEDKPQVSQTSTQLKSLKGTSWKTKQMVSANGINGFITFDFVTEKEVVTSVLFTSNGEQVLMGPDEPTQTYTYSAGKGTMSPRAVNGLKIVNYSASLNKGKYRGTLLYHSDREDPIEVVEASGTPTLQEGDKYGIIDSYGHYWEIVKGLDLKIESVNGDTMVVSKQGDKMTLYRQ